MPLPARIRFVLRGVCPVHLLRTSVRGFSALEHHLADRLSEQMSIQAGRRPSPGERRSWERSIPALRADLISAGLGDVEMLIEFQLPLTSQRADVLLAGEHPTSGRPSYVVVELKQWSAAERFEDSDTLVTVEHYGRRAVTHPALQVQGYCDYLTDFARVLTAPHELIGAAYLHNATDRLVRNVYKVLLTRGLRGVAIYSTDEQTRDHLRTLVGPTVVGGFQP